VSRGVGVVIAVSSAYSTLVIASQIAAPSWAADSTAFALSDPSSLQKRMTTYL
jgi:hypothetical protein